MSKIESLYRTFLQKQQDNGLYRSLTDIKPTNPMRFISNGIEYINFASNDYLGLSHHPLLVERAQEWAKTYGVGCGASRLVTGNYEPYRIIE